MTVSTELSHEEYVGNGVTTDFDLRFRIFESRHLIVVVADSEGNETTLKNGTDYTIVGAGSFHGGKVVLNKPLAKGWKILLERDLPVVQETDLRNQGKFFAEVHEDAFDYLTMLIQKALGTFSLSLRKPTYLSNYYDAKGNRIANLAPPKLGTDSANKDYVDNSIKDIDSKTLRVKDKAIPALPSAEQRANKILAFDDNGQPITILPESGSATDVLMELGKPTGASMIGVQPSGNLQQMLNFVTPEQFGAVGDGIHDDTNSFIDMFKNIRNGTAVQFRPNATYLFSNSVNNGDVSGTSLFKLSHVKGISFKGKNTTLKVVGHDISQYGGLLLFEFSAVKSLVFSGVNFDMSFIGFNTSSSFYPLCGAVFINDNEDGMTFDDVSSDLLFEDLNFKLFHPLGCAGMTDNPRDLDYNNGFKILSIYARGNRLLSGTEKESRDIKYKNVSFKDGHNGYGLWTWAFSNVVLDGGEADSWITMVSKVPEGTTVRGSIPLFRYIPFHCSGSRVENYIFNAKQTIKRAGSFAGRAKFYGCENNLGASTTLSIGNNLVIGNTINLGMGDPSGDDRFNDVGCYDYTFGDFNIINNKFGSVDNGAHGAIPIVLGNSDQGAQHPQQDVIISGNKFDGGITGGCIMMYTGSVTSERKLRSVKISGNKSISCSYFVRQVGYTLGNDYGCEVFLAINNIISTTNNAYFPPINRSNYAFYPATSKDTDSCIIRDNVISNFYLSIRKDSLFTEHHRVIAYGNKLIEVKNNSISNNYIQNAIIGDKLTLSSSNISELILENNNNGELTVSKITQEKTQSTQKHKKTHTIIVDDVSVAVFSSEGLVAGVNGVSNLGNGARRWGTVYATNGTINTSDVREKLFIDITPSEISCARELLNCLTKYKWKDTKMYGNKIHFGVGAQHVVEVFTKHGLNAEDYGVVYHDSWDEFIDENRNTVPAGDRYGVNYNDLICFIMLGYFR